MIALLISGCGKTTIDTGKAEGFVRGTFTPPARSADCPSGVEAKKGKTFQCTAVSTAGRRFRVTLHVLDDKGHVSVGQGDVVPGP